MSASSDLNALSTPRKLLVGGGALLFVNSFLPWYHASVLGVSISQNGWHQLGVLAWLVLIVVLVWEVLRIVGSTPVGERQADLYSAVGALVAVVLGVIFVIQRLSDGYLGIGFWIGIVLLIAVGYGAFQLFTASGGQAALRDVQQQASERRAAQGGGASTPPATPPATPPTVDDPAVPGAPPETPEGQQPARPQDPPPAV